MANGVLTITNWNLMSLKSLCMAKEVTNRVKRKATKWKNILASGSSDKVLITRKYKEFGEL